MINSFLRRGTKALAVFCSLAALVAGCDDGLICQSEKLVYIVEPSGVVTQDVNATMDGVQTDVDVRSTFGEGATLTLTVEDDDGNALTTLMATTDAQGNARFDDVTIPGAGADLRVVGDAGECGRDEDVLHVELGGGSGDCVLEFATAPEENAFYAPLDVFNSSSDGNAAMPGYQGDLIVRTTPGDGVVLFLSGPGAVETQIGSGTANDLGDLRLAMSLPEGQDNLRIECSGPNGLSVRSSGVVSVFVDTVAPTCALTSPVPGTSITPSLDEDMNLANGIQLELEGRATGGDTQGEGARFVVTAPGGTMTTLTGSAIDAMGDSTADASFNPATPPADFGVAFSTIDHAGNACMASTTYRVVYDGCPIVVTAPTMTVTTDADGNSANGAQVDVVLDVDDACIGRMVTSDCGSNDPGATVAAGGAATLRADVCGAVPCESSELCTVRVTSTDGIETTAGVNLSFDNQPPNVSVQIVAPAVPCGSVVTPSDDIDGAMAGTQVRVRVVSPSAADRRLQITNGAGTMTLDANGVGGEVVTTIENGSNSLIGIARDAAGNTAMTPTCGITLADIAVTFTGAAADGMVGASDGTVVANDLTFTLTGTVSEPTATVSVTVDGGAAQPAVVVGTSWSVVLTLAGRAAPYAIVATATAGPRTGVGNLSLVVDLSPPPGVTNLTGTPITRRTIRLNFTAPNDGGAAVSAYRIRYATTALTDANFDSTGTAAPAPTPGAPGTNETVNVTLLRAGTAYWLGVAAVDGSGNRGVAQIVGPITPAFDATDVITAPNTVGNAGFGNGVVRGRFNDDAFEDVAVAAPFVTSGGMAAAGEVYVYLGSAVGLATSPAVTIRGTTAGGQLGNSIARVRWSSTTRDDLAIGAPFAGSIFVFNGGASFPSGSVADSSAQRRITSNTSANWFTGCGFGWKMASGDHDGDGTEDLFASMVFGGAGTAGAAVVFYGGTVPSGTVAISDLTANGSGTAVVRMYEVISPNFPGIWFHNLGPTQGSADLTDDIALGFDESVADQDVLVFRGSGRPGAAGVTREPFTVGRDVRLRFITPDTTSQWGATMGSLDDQNGDGARDIVIGDWRDGSNEGRVHILDGDTVGTAGVATTIAPGVVLSDLRRTDINAQLGVAILNNADASDADVDGDGREDLVIAARVGTTTQAALHVWFGPIPAGLQSPAAPDTVIAGPGSFQAVPPSNNSPGITGAWADVNNDGLEDICWADWTSNGLDGGLQVLWDDGN